MSKKYQDKIWVKEYYVKNKDKINKYGLEYYYKNKKKVQKYAKKYYAENREKYLEKYHKEKVPKIRQYKELQLSKVLETPHSQFQCNLFKYLDENSEFKDYNTLKERAIELNYKYVSEMIVKLYYKLTSAPKAGNIIGISRSAIQQRLKSWGYPIFSTNSKREIAKKVSGELTQAELKRILNYDEKTGIFTWKVRNAHCVNIGDVAGTTTSYGKIHIKINEKKYYAHRLVWLYVHGEFPKKDVKHIVGDKNIISNLKLEKRIANISSGKEITIEEKEEKKKFVNDKIQNWRNEIKVDRMRSLITM